MSDTADMLAKAERLGFRFVGHDGRNHLRLVHENGEYSIANTPSDWRTRANELAALERIAGRKLERHHHRRSRKNITMSGFSVTGTHTDGAVAARIAELNDIHEAQRIEWEALIANPTRDAALRARDLLHQIARVEADLERLHQPVDRIMS